MMLSGLHARSWNFAGAFSNIEVSCIATIKPEHMPMSKSLSYS